MTNPHEILPSSREIVPQRSDNGKILKGAAIAVGSALALAGAAAAGYHTGAFDAVLPESAAGVMNEIGRTSSMGYQNFWNYVNNPTLPFGNTPLYDTGLANTGGAIYDRDGGSFPSGSMPWNSHHS